MKLPRLNWIPKNPPPEGSAPSLPSSRVLAPSGGPCPADFD
jgi:hypothetical protein